MSDLYHCTYKKVFPIDEYGRLGGLYSLADLPIMEHKEMSRSGVIVEKNEEEQFYKVRDMEKNFEEWVPMMDVTVVQDPKKLLNEGR
ncbi:MAG TPA: hypothetical protein EYO93_01685 [Nitrososphaerales archaeon]|nr:hypothetical protein [Nitrososphaerales archaeon]